MELIDHLQVGFATALTPVNLVYCFFGVLLGTAIGVLPGVGPLATIALLLPFTFSLSPVGSLIMLAGIYYGAQYGGSTTAILINLPGESSSAVTAIDGYQMARQGRAGPALATAALGSFFAGTFADGGHRPVRTAVDGTSARIRSRRVFRPHGARADLLGRPGARVDSESAQHDRARPPARAGRHGPLCGNAALHPWPAGSCRRAQLRGAGGRRVRHRRDPAQPRERCRA